MLSISCGHDCQSLVGDTDYSCVGFHISCLLLVQNQINYILIDTRTLTKVKKKKNLLVNPD